MEKIEALIQAEQSRQNGKFLGDVELNRYISKIKSNAEILSHQIEEECAGVVAFYCNNLESREAYVTLVLTNPRFRGMGIAKNLLGMALVVARKRGFKTCALEVINDNQGAIRLYESLGFSDFEQKETSKIMKVSLANPKVCFL